MNLIEKLKSRTYLFVFINVCLISFSCGQKTDSGESKVLSFSELKYTDIGAATKPGSILIDQNKLQMKAGGADIWGTNDEFYFGYTALKGDFDIRVQVLELGKANQYTKAGIMARTNLDDNSKHVYFQLFPDNTSRNKNNGGCEFQYRAEIGAEMKAIYPEMETAGNKFDVNFPNTWIRLKRQGDVFESYISSDNKIWELYSTYSLKLPGELLVGLAVTSHNSDEFATAGFGQIQLK
ncbi:MAG: hypothetical protein HQ541_18190 [Mariniphaga sp.]|nr:hypothetical protein [Mariniphaga sp.]